MSTLLRRLATFALTLGLALASIGAAARMAPNPELGPAQEILALAGYADADLCGLPGGAGDHFHCPFCHKLGSTPEVAVSLKAERLALVPAWDQLSADQRLGPQSGNPHVSPRAPPALA